MIVYSLDNVVQVEDVVCETLVQPSGANLFISESLSLVVQSCVSYNTIEKQKFVPYNLAQHIIIPIFRYNYNMSETS